MTWPTTPVATGELVPAATLNQLPILLQKAADAGATYDFQSIPAAWTHLLLVCALQTGSGAAFDDVYLRLNNDSAANYYDERIRGFGTTVSGTERLGATSIRIGECSGGATAGFATIVCLLSKYGAAQIHSVASFNFGGRNTATTNQVTWICGGWWNSPSIINRITLIPQTGSFVAGAGAWLYGLGTI
jgi:hypothetical protein